MARLSDFDWGAAQADRVHERKELEERVQAVQGLLKSRAWATMRAAFAGAVASAKAAARKAETAHQMGLHLGAALALEDVLSWPERELSQVMPLLQEPGQGT